eukprot:scaffold44295_cov28-Tisochrysis_lutea.AAC.2
MPSSGADSMWGTATSTSSPERREIAATPPRYSKSNLVARSSCTLHLSVVTTAAVDSLEASGYGRSSKLYTHESPARCDRRGGDESGMRFGKRGSRSRRGLDDT